jgi:hypothetical protein
LSPKKRKKIRTSGNNDDEEVKKLLSDYSNIILKLKRLGVLKTSRILSDVGAYFVCNKMGLTRVSNPLDMSYDAVDDKGLKYDIKTRKVTTANKSTVFTVMEGQLIHSDFLIYVEFDNLWNIVKLLKIPSNKVKPNLYNRVRITKDLVEKYSVL